MGWNKYDGPSPPMGTGPAAAVSVVQNVMSSLQTQMNSATTAAMSTLDALGSLQVPATGPMPDIAVPPRHDMLPWAPPEGLDIAALGDLDTELPAAPETPTIDTNISVDIPTWSPSVVALNIPNAPAPIDTSSLPARPAVNTSISMPSRPTLDTPVMEAMTSLTIPAFASPTLPTFTDPAPEFMEAAPNPVIAWTEPTYMSESLTEVQAAIKRMLDGQTGLPPEIEQQLFDRARAREDMTAGKAVAEAFDDFANKGFTMPPGALVAQVNEVREKNGLAVQSLQREIMTKVADIAVENVREGVRQALSAENLLVNIFNNAAQRAFEMARFTVESQIQLYNAKAQVFNTLMSAYATKAQVFKVKVDAALSALEVYRVQMEGQRIVGELNRQKVAVFDARVQAMMSQVELYKTDMQAAQVQVEVIRSQLDAYRTDVQAYAENINAQKTRFDAYRTQVEGEVAKVGILDAEARVYAARVQAGDTKANIQLKRVQTDLEKMSADTQRYAALLDGSKAELQAKLGKIEANARVAGLNIQYMSAQTDAERAKHEADVRIAEAQLQSGIAITNATIERYKVAVNKILQEADLQARSLQAAGQIASTLAGGAMAAQHVQASIGANASDSTSVNYGYNQQAVEQWTYEGEQ